ncbi:MAG: hypothetical protein HQ559_15645 [Lentisphaerae bacterium]|nr:hypothetical protein [Lentisphaerota bacterium]
MIFREPIPFQEAIESRLAKTLLPTTASSRELAGIPAELKERSFFSARTNNARHLARTDTIIKRIIAPTGKPGEYMNEARARQLIRASLQSIGYDPADIDAVPGSLKDLASEARVRVMLDTNVKMARNYGNWKQGQTEAILDQWPAQELTRHESRQVQRNWRERWNRARSSAGVVGQSTDGYSGRMAALKNSPIWTALSRFGLPYPPFDYLSGMGVDDVDRDDAERLGIIDRDTIIQPQERPFNQSLQARSPADPQRQPGLLEAIVSAMGERVFLQDGVLHFAPTA